MQGDFFPSLNLAFNILGRLKFRYEVPNRTMRSQTVVYTAISSCDI
jgi:hypothetical protein